MTDDGAAGGRPPAASLRPDPFARTDAPLYSVRLWPHQSMTRAGFRWFMGALAAGLAFPLLAVWDTPVAWFLTPFLLGALALVWTLVRLNQRHRRMSETVRVWPDAVAVERRDSDGRVRRWAANPHWVRIDLSDTPRIERYLTLSGGGRRIELGSFLTPQERVSLAQELRRALGETRA
jgi:uncharacterized membrane protein